MAITNIPNEVALEQVLYKTETVAGTGVVPTARLLGTWQATPGIGAIRRGQDATGLYDRTARGAGREQADASGSYTEKLTFETFPVHMRLGVKGGGSGVSDGAAIPAYTYTKSPAGKVDDIDSATIYGGVDGLAWRSTGVRWNEWNISGDATNSDNQWTLSATPFIRDVALIPGGFDGIATGGSTTTVVQTAAGWTINAWTGAYVYIDAGSHIGEVRTVASNTADTLTLTSALSGAVTAADKFYISGLLPTIPNAVYETIEMEGTEVFLDAHNPSATSIGTTLISDRVVSFNVTQTINLARKRRASGVIGRVGRGERQISGVIRLELDRPDEYRNWTRDDELSIRIQKKGSTINAPTSSTKLARIDIECAVIDGMTLDADNNNRTASFAFVAELPDSAPIATFTGINKLATLA